MRANEGSTGSGSDRVSTSPDNSAGSTENTRSLPLPVLTSTLQGS